MKKQTFRRLAAWLAALLMLISCAGCAFGGNAPASSVSPDSFDSPDSSETTVGPPAMLAPTGQAGVYTLRDITFTHEMVRLSLMNHVLLIEEIDPGMNSSESTLTAYDFRTGKRLGSITLPADIQTVDRLDNGGFAVTSFSEGKVTFYGVDCQPGKSVTFRAAGGVGSAAVSPDGKYLLYAVMSTGDTLIYDLTARKPVTLARKISISEIFRYDQGGFYARVLAVDGEGCDGVWRVSGDGAVSDIGMRTGNQLVWPYIFEYSLDDRYFVRSVDNPHAISFGVDESDSPIAASRNHIVVSGHGGTRFYDYRTGKISDYYGTAEDCPAMSVFADGGAEYAFAILRTESGNSATVYALDEIAYPHGTSTVDEGTEYDISKGYYPTWDTDFDGVDGAKELAQELLDTYGVRVMIRSDRLEKDGFADKTVERSKPENVYTKLQEIRKFLELFPKEMPRQIYKGQDVWIYLTDRLSERGENARPIEGVASRLMEHPFIILENCCSDSAFAETLAHEFCHVFENNISDAWLDGWLALSPDGLYYMSYGNDSDLKYTPYGNGETVWFPSSYARTYPTEDRAVIFQKMYRSCFSGEKSMEIQAPNVQKKVDYLCRMLRASYPCLTDDFTCFWDK